MWYIIELGTEETMAMTKKREVAELIAKTLETVCEIRWGER